MADDTAIAAAKLDRAIVKLTEPHTTQVKQRPAKGGWKLAAVHHLPLIVQLEAAVVGDLGGGVGLASNTAALPMNVDAMQKLADLRRDVVVSWGRLVPHSRLLVVELEPRRSLTMWHTTLQAYLSDDLGAERLLESEAQRWDWWVYAIERMFAPERTIEYTRPCPGCGLRHVDTEVPYGDERSGSYTDRRPAITITLRDPLDKSTATCSNPECGMSWHGQAGLQKLADGVPTKRRDEQDSHNTP